MKFLITCQAHPGTDGSRERGFFKSTTSSERGLPARAERPPTSARARCPRLYGPPRNCKGEVVRAGRFSCTLVSGLCRGNVGSRALMESAHASPHLPDGLEWAQRGLRLVACRSDLSCHRLHFFLATVGDLGAAWNRLPGVLPSKTDTERFPGPVHGRAACESPKRRWAGGGNRGARSRYLHYEPSVVCRFVSWDLHVIWPD